MTSCTIRITGLVQGVFFRDRTKVKADELNIMGWVKNTDNGAVEIHAEGSDGALKQLEEWCHQGPPHAKVERVEVSEAKEEGCEKFEIVW